ncbi:ABC transporter ATP-binding protein [Nocardioides sp. GY 10113]|uniref:ABC transporter ATP-binding protein n=1 Tax=Nocardioides sp. GY 10113 TaxID=2569761 RepID=UPI0010A922C6|nr:ABC transporter ATP-binding protein [Nocardioides sp. GY 10113]TIC88618.1 ABC transporter ATP-binding protein [Nocardioides sp. GY 10113]
MTAPTGPATPATSIGPNGELAPIVEVRDLVVSYAGRRVSSMERLDVRAGECVAVVGESGSGKSTLLQAMTGLLAGTGAETTGSVTVDGLDVLSAPERRLRAIRGSRVAMVMQSPQGSLNPTMRLGTLIRRVLKRHGVTGAAAKARIAAALDGVQLDAEVLNRYPHQVSGGQAQRFAIALAVALEAGVIAADEPTSALDVTVQAEVIGVLQRLRAERGVAVVLVSHDLALVSTVADRIVVMKDGAVVDEGDVDHVLRRSTCAYTRELVAAVPTIGGDR